MPPLVPNSPDFPIDKAARGAFLPLQADRGAGPAAAAFPRARGDNGRPRHRVNCPGVGNKEARLARGAMGAWLMRAEPRKLSAVFIESFRRGLSPPAARGRRNGPRRTLMISRRLYVRPRERRTWGGGRVKADFGAAWRTGRAGENRAERASCA